MGYRYCVHKCVQFCDLSIVWLRERDDRTYISRSIPNIHHGQFQAPKFFRHPFSIAVLRCASFTLANESNPSLYTTATTLSTVRCLVVRSLVNT